MHYSTYYSRRQRNPRTNDQQQAVKPPFFSVAGERGLKKKSAAPFFAAQSSSDRSIEIHEQEAAPAARGALGKPTEDDYGSAIGQEGAGEVAENGSDVFQSERFRGNEVLEACYKGEVDQYLRNGSTGTAVEKVQQTLLDLNYELPQYGADGQFGTETGNAVAEFKRDHQIFPSDPVVGIKTIHALDGFLAAIGGGGTFSPECTDGQVDTAKDPLPPVPQPTITRMDANDLLQLVKKKQPAGSYVPSSPPLGATLPSFENVKAVVSKPVSLGNGCFNCAAEWVPPVPKVEIFIATGSFSDEPKRIFGSQDDKINGCPLGVSHKEVRKVILPEAEPVILGAEMEHYNDFVASYLLVMGRYISTARRLIAERTHLRGGSQQECSNKVKQFLADQVWLKGWITWAPLFQFSDLSATNTLNLHATTTSKRDEKEHSAVSIPAQGLKPILPNLNHDINPFGCKAYFRKFDRTLLPDFPGKPFDALVDNSDINIPAKQEWHTL